MTLLLGIDVGTSSAKAVLFDVDSAQTLAVAGQEYPVLKPAPDRAEQDPDTWWQAVVNATRQVVAEAGRNDVAAIGFSGQMHGTVLLDQTGNPVHPAIIWADQRSAAECEELIATLGAAAYAQLAGTLPAVGFMGATLLWLAKHDPALLEKTHKVVFPKDYVRLKMTGRISTEVSDAASSGIF
ncbi:MAG: xylulokinase, partial [Anaerolineae bacterium]|nr:xylulokinase [Anaerolineae bacterium]